MKIYPLIIALLLATVMAGMQFVSTGLALPTSPPAYLGVVMMAMGGALVLWSAGIFRRRNTTLNPQGEPSTLATEGLYRFSRNPMYLGMLLGLIGLALLLGNIWQLGGAALFAGITSIQIRQEEALLTQRFGEAYREYQSRVRRWL